MTELLQEVETDPFVIPYVDDGKDKLTHIINPPKNTHIWRPGMEPKEIVEIARLTDQEIEALCGYRWVPKADPDRHDICKTCMQIATDIMQSMGQ